MKQMKYKKQIQLITAIFTLIVFPVIAFYLMEAYTHNPFEEVRPWAQFFNILLFELLAWIFVSVTGKIQSGLRIELVTDGFEIGTRHIHRRTVRKVAAVRQIEAHERIAGFQHGEENGHVGLRARVGLHVGVFRAVELADALDGQRLDLVHDLAASVVAGAGIAFGVFVGQHRPHCLHDLVADIVFRGDQLDAFRLALALGADQIENLRISFHNMC